MNSHDWVPPAGIGYQAWFENVRGLEPAPREAQLDQLSRWFMPAARRIAATVLRMTGAPSKMYEDSLSVTLCEYTTLVIEIVDGKVSPTNFEGLLQYRAKKALWKVIESSAGTNPASGMSGKRRRQHRLAQLREELPVTLGRQPTNEELIDYANREARETRRDPVKQGRVYTPDDLVDVTYATELDPDSAGVAIDPMNNGGPMEALDRKQLAREVMVTARCHGEDIAKTAELVWEGQTADDPDDIPTVRDLVIMTGWSESKARRNHTLVVQTIPRQILEQKFGITSPDGR